MALSNFSFTKVIEHLNSTARSQDSRDPVHQIGKVKCLSLFEKKSQQKSMVMNYDEVNTFQPQPNLISVGNVKYVAQYFGFS